MSRNAYLYKDVENLPGSGLAVPIFAKKQFIHGLDDILRIEELDNFFLVRTQTSRLFLGSKVAPAEGNIGASQRQVTLHECTEENTEKK